MTETKGYLTTHVLDTSLGLPAADLQIELYALEGGNRRHIRTMKTNSDGRTDGPILPCEEFKLGVYELVFLTENYLKRTALAQAAPFFLADIPIRFGINDLDAHYHVPLLLSPYGYSTYRGS